HIAHGADVAMSESARGFLLSGHDRPQARTKVFAEIRRLTEAEADDRKCRLGIVLAQPVLQGGRQQAEDAEIPDHQLNKSRYVAMVRDVDADSTLRDAAWHQPD